MNRNLEICFVACTFNPVGSWAIFSVGFPWNTLVLCECQDSIKIQPTITKSLNRQKSYVHARTICCLTEHFSKSALWRITCNWINIIFLVFSVLFYRKRIYDSVPLNLNLCWHRNSFLCVWKDSWSFSIFYWASDTRVKCFSFDMKLTFWLSGWIFCVEKTHGMTVLTIHF